MPFKIGWLDEKLHIYDIVLSDPFTLADQDQFFAEFFKFVDAGPAPMFGVFDLSRWSQSGAAALNDPRFKKMGNYHEKIVVIVMVTTSKVAAAMGRLGAAVVGYHDWIRFEESRETAIKYLTERATADLALKNVATKVPASQAQVPQTQAAKEPTPQAQAPQTPKGPTPQTEISKEQELKEQAPRAQVSQVQEPKDQVSKEQPAKDQAPKPK